MSNYDELKKELDKSAVISDSFKSFILSYATAIYQDGFHDGLEDAKKANKQKIISDFEKFVEGLEKKEFYLEDFPREQIIKLKRLFYFKPV